VRGTNPPLLRHDPAATGQSRQSRPDASHIEVMYATLPDVRVRVDVRGGRWRDPGIHQHHQRQRPVRGLGNRPVRLPGKAYGGTLYIWDGHELKSDQEHADAHGAALARQDRCLWVADRGRNFLWVVDTGIDKVVNRIHLVNELSVDPTPDLLSVAPDGRHVFMSLRGPVPLTADPHVSTGTTPGIGVLQVLRGGRSARFEYIARVSNIDANAVERADIHASTVRLKTRGW
jgi:hypothetical protein